MPAVSFTLTSPYEARPRSVNLGELSPQMTKLLQEAGEGQHKGQVFDMGHMVFAAEHVSNVKVSDNPGDYPIEWLRE